MRGRPAMVVCLLAAQVLAAACSGSDVARVSDPRDAVDAQPATTQPWSEFCGGAVELIEFLDTNSAALLDPTRAAGFLAGAKERLGALEGSAPEAIAAEVVALRGAYIELGRLLAEVGYDVARLDGEELLAEIDTEASLAFDNFLVSDCGYGAAPEGQAPSVLSNEELAELLGEPSDREGEAAEPDRLLSALLSEGSGWDVAEVECVLAELSVDTKRELIDGGLGGGEVSPEAADEFARSLETCGIDERGS